jgi:hypothetical protein
LGVLSAIAGVVRPSALWLVVLSVRLLAALRSAKAIAYIGIDTVAGSRHAADSCRSHEKGNHDQRIDLYQVGIDLIMQAEEKYTQEGFLAACYIWNR